MSDILIVLHTERDAVALKRVCDWWLDDRGEIGFDENQVHFAKQALKRVRKQLEDSDII